MQLCIEKYISNRKRGGGEIYGNNKKLTQAWGNNLIKSKKYIKLI